MNIERPHYKINAPDAKLVFKGEIFDVYQWETKGYDGKARTFEKLVRKDTALVIPVTTEGKIIVAKQEQPHKDPYVALLGGRIDDGEEVLDAAKRELLEESGYASDTWELFLSDQPISKIDWVIYTFIAKNCTKVADQSLDGAEKIELIYYSPEEFVDFVLSKEFDYPELQLLVMRRKIDNTLNEFISRLKN